jgi:hypothetical protein
MNEQIMQSENLRSHGFRNAIGSRSPLSNAFGLEGAFERGGGDHFPVSRSLPSLRKYKAIDDVAGMNSDRNPIFLGRGRPFSTLPGALLDELSSIPLC